MNNVNNSHILVLVYFLVFWFFFSVTQISETDYNDQRISQPDLIQAEYVEMLNSMPSLLRSTLHSYLHFWQRKFTWDSLEIQLTFFYWNAGFHKMSSKRISNIDVYIQYWTYRKFKKPHSMRTWLFTNLIPCLLYKKKPIHCKPAFRQYTFGRRHRWRIGWSTVISEKNPPYSKRACCLYSGR